MAESLGGDSNRIVEFFAELERWEAVLSERPDLPVDGPNEPNLPPD